jgi:hypothetical protein
MKKSMLGSVLLAAALLFTPLANAGQIVNRVNVPFPFVVSGKTLPAGAYNIQRLERAPNILVIRNLDTNKLTAIMTSMETSSAQSAAVLVFGEVGDQHYLRAVRVPGASFSWPLTKTEKQLAEAETTTAVNGQQ